MLTTLIFIWAGLALLALLILLRVTVRGTALPHKQIQEGATPSPATNLTLKESMYAQRCGRALRITCRKCGCPAPCECDLTFGGAGDYSKQEPERTLSGAESVIAGPVALATTIERTTSGLGQTLGGSNDGRAPLTPRADACNNFGELNDGTFGGSDSPVRCGTGDGCGDESGPEKLPATYHGVAGSSPAPCPRCERSLGFYDFELGYCEKCGYDLNA